MVIKQKPKIIFFDMEGTLFKKVVRIGETTVAPSAWYAIAKILGPKALEEELKTQLKWKDNQYRSYIEWMEDTIEIHKKYGLTKQVFHQILDSIEYISGVNEVFRLINKQKIPTVLLSGGFKYQANRAIRDLIIKHAFVACEYFWDDKGYLYHYNLLPGDYRGKLDFMKLIIKEYNVSEKECAFIGDGDNDVYLAKNVGLSIAFNGSKKLSNITTYNVFQEEGKENFIDIINLLNLK